MKKTGKISGIKKSVEIYLKKYYGIYNLRDYCGIKSSKNKFFLGNISPGKKKIFLKIMSQPFLLANEIKANNLVQTIPELNKYVPQIFCFNKEVNTPSFICFEYISGLTMNDIIINNVNISHKNKEIILKQFLKILNTLHNNNIIHRDIRPSNIIIQGLDTHNPIKTYLIDFTFAITPDSKALPEIKDLKEIINIYRLGGSYRKKQLIWDDAYSFCCLAKNIENNITNSFPELWLKFSEKIDKLSYKT